MELPIKLLSSEAKLPTRGSEHACGLDLYSPIHVSIKPSEKVLIKTDIGIAIPNGYYGRIAPRSSMAWKKHSDIGAGIIDSDYRGNIGVVLFNLSTENTIEIEPGDRIAQLIIQKYEHVLPKLVSNLEETARNEGGFGSSGK